ncbi:MAG: Ig-like domain-containing protein [Solobacterium sp.]|nr:Ig-like domain-containing protein [Solobacterium sp.]
MPKMIKRYISWLLSALMCFNSSFTVTHAEEPVQTEEPENLEVMEEEQTQSEQPETAEEISIEVEEKSPETTEEELTVEENQEELPEETVESDEIVVEETEETPEPEQEQTEEETTLPAEETAEPETTETPAEETAEPEETEEPAAQYEVTFDAGDGHFEDGSTSLTVTVEEGTLLTEVPEVFADEELELVGWFLEGSGEPVDFTIFEVTESVTLIAEWIEKSIVTADNIETEITVEPGAYSAVIKFSVNSYISTLYFVYSTDSTDTLLTEKESVTYSDISNANTLYKIKSDYNLIGGRYEYEWHVDGKNNTVLTPNTAYYVQIYLYSSGSYVQLGSKFSFTTATGIEQTAVAIKDIQVQDGYVKSRVTFNFDNPNNEELIETRLFVTQPDGTEGSTTYYTTYNSTEKYYYADVPNKWEAGYSVKIGVKVPEGEGELKHIESEALSFSPKDPSEITTNISAEALINSAVIKAEFSPYYSWDSLSPYVYYRKKGDTDYKSQYGYYSSYSNQPTSASIKLTKLEPNTEYEYYKVDQYYQNGTNVTLRSDGSADAPLTFTTRELVTYSESDFDPALYKELRSFFKLAEEDSLTNANFENITDLTIRLSQTQSSSYYSGSTYMNLYLKEPMKSLKGVDKFEVLTHLSAEGHDITDISPIQKMTGITNLDLDYNDLTVMPDLSGFTSLKYPSVYYNMIDPDTITTDKFPASVENIENYISNFKTEQRNDSLMIPDQFYDHSDKKTAAVYYAGMKSGRSYTLTLTIDGKTTDITYNNTSYNNDRVFLEEDAETAFGTTFDYDKDYSASFTIKDEFGTTYKEAVKNIRFVKDTRETEVSYVSSDSTNVYVYDIYLPEEFSSAAFTKAELINASGAICGKTETVSTRTSSTRYEERYHFPSSVYYSEATSYTYISSLRINLIKRLKSGTYSARLTTSDNRTLMINDCLVVYSVEDPAILDSIYQDSDYNSLGDYIFVELSGKNINPDKIWPVLYYQGKQATETTPAAHYYDGSTPVYKLKKTGDCWKEDSLNLEFKFEVQDGYEYINNISGSTLYYYAGDSYKYDVYESWYNWKREQFEATAANPDKIVKVIAYNNSSDRSKDVNRIGETEEFTITEDCILAFNLKFNEEVFKPVSGKTYYLKYYSKDGETEYSTTANVSVRYPSDEVDTGNAYVQLSKYLYNTQVTSIDSIFVGIPAETAVDTASMKFELTDQAGTVYGTSNSITAGTAVRNNINYNTYSVKNWTLTTPITEDGMYNIAFTDDKQPYVTTAITVLITDTFYMTYMYGSFSTNYSTNTTVFNLNMDTPELNSAASAAAAKELWTDKKYKLEVFDALGTPVTGWSITGYSSRTLTISGLSTEYVGLYFRVTRNGVRPRDYQQARQADGTYPEYYESEYGHYVSTGRSTVYATGKSYNVYLGIGFGPEAVFPYTIRLYQKGTNQLFKSITVSSRSGLSGSIYRYFTKDDLKNVPENEYLDIKVVNQYEMCVYSTQGYLEPRDVPATSITLNASSLTVNEGETAQLTAIVTPANTTDIVVWKSSDASIVSIDETGKITGVSGGEATITATAGTVSAECLVTVVIPAEKIEILTEVSEIEYGKSETLEVTFTPSDTTHQKVTWASSDESIATVDENGVVTAVGEGKVTITATSEGGLTASKEISILFTHLTGISFKEESADIIIHESKELELIYDPENASLKTVTWESSDDSVATVDENGTVTAVNGGSAVIKATSEDGNLTAEITVNVIVPAEKIEIQTEVSEIEYGESETLEVTFKPSNTTNQKVTWTSSDESIATVDENGVVTAVGEGKVIITATSEDGGFTASKEINVLFTHLTGISFKEESADIIIHESKELELIYDPENASLKTVTWESSDESVATVDENGKVTAVGDGTATITVTSKDGGYSASIEIHVIIPAQSITISSEVTEILYGNSETLEVAFTPSNTTNQKVTWTSSDESIATVDENGVVTAVGEGKVTITATSEDGGFTASKEINILFTHIESIAFTEEEVSGLTGETVQLKTLILPEDATVKDVTYKSDNEDVATVDENGLVRILAGGKAYITVTTKDGEKTATVKVVGYPEGISVQKLPDYTYTGQAFKPEVKVYDRGVLLTEKTDYTVTYKNNVKAGEASVIIKSNKKGNYKDTQTVYFTIHPADISEENPDIIVDALSVQATGKPLSPVPVIYFNGKKLKNKTDYTVSYDNFGDRTAAGKHTVTITGIKNFSGTRDVTVSVAPQDFVSVSKLKVTTKPVSYSDLTGDFMNDFAGRITVKNGKDELVKGIEYAVLEDSAVNCDSIGSCTFNIEGKGRYVGQKTVTVKITGTSLADKKIRAELPVYVYTGEEIELGNDFALLNNGMPLEEGTDYEITGYSKNINAGTATATLKGINKYTGTRKVNYKILPDTSRVADNRIAVAEAVYTKGGAKPAVLINGMTEGVDYTVKYTNNTKAGTYGTATVTYKGNYKGAPSSIKQFYIKQKDIKDVTITAKDLVYKKGKYQSTPVLTDTDGKKLKAGTDYEKTYEYTGNIIGGDAQPDTEITVTVKGTGNYTGTVSATYRILNTGKDISKATFKITAKEYTGSEVTLSEADIIATINKTTPLQLGTDYEIVGYTNNVKKGNAKVTFRGINGYGGTKTVSFKIGQRSITDYWKGINDFFARMF